MRCSGMRYADLDQIPLKLAREGRISGDTVSFTLPDRTLQAITLLL
jgi:hypothetical protein